MLLTNKADNSGDYESNFIISGYLTINLHYIDCSNQLITITQDANSVLKVVVQ